MASRTARCGRLLGNQLEALRIGDWLERIRHIQDFRRLNADCFDRAGSDPAILRDCS